MKHSIKTMIDSYEMDNDEYIRESGKTVAEFILDETEAEDHGWQWFLSEEEEAEYETASPERREEIRNEIRDYLGAYYNYKPE